MCGKKSITVKKASGDKNAPSTYDMVLEGFKAKLCVCTICDEQGNLLFSIADAGLLNISMSARNIEKIVSVAQRLNAVTEQDKEEVLKTPKQTRKTVPIPTCRELGIAHP